MISNINYNDSLGYRLSMITLGILLVLEGNELDIYISIEVLVAEGDEAKALQKKNLVKAKKIIADSIKDNVIPQVSSLNTNKYIF